MVGGKLFPIKMVKFQGRTVKLPGVNYELLTGKLTCHLRNSGLKLEAFPFEMSLLF